jgi:hypothetical protein
LAWLFVLGIVAASVFLGVSDSYRRFMRPVFGEPGVTGPDAAGQLLNAPFRLLFVIEAIFLVCVIVAFVLATGRFSVNLSRPRPKYVPRRPPPLIPLEKEARPMPPWFWNGVLGLGAALFGLGLAGANLFAIAIGAWLLMESLLKGRFLHRKARAA